VNLRLIDWSVCRLRLYHKTARGFCARNRRDRAISANNLPFTPFSLRDSSYIQTSAT